MKKEVKKKFNYFSNKFARLKNLLTFAPAFKKKVKKYKREVHCKDRIRRRKKVKKLTVNSNRVDRHQKIRSQKTFKILTTESLILAQDER